VHLTLFAADLTSLGGYAARKTKIGCDESPVRGKLARRLKPTLVRFPFFVAQFDIPLRHDLSSMTMGQGKWRLGLIGVGKIDKASN